MSSGGEKNPLSEAELKLVDDMWKREGSTLAEALDKFDWPGGVARREALATVAEQARKTKGFLTKEMFDEILRWGFGSGSTLQETDIRATTKAAFERVAAGDTTGALERLQDLPGIGVSRASKILALSDQENLPIYDSRAASALTSIQGDGGKPLIAVPPGRSKDLAGTPGVSQARLTREYPKYTAVVRRLLENAQRDPRYAGKFERVADMERALFSAGKKASSSSPTSATTTPSTATRSITRGVAGAAVAGAAVGAINDLPAVRQGKLSRRAAAKRRVRDALSAGGGTAAASVAERFGKATSRSGALAQNSARGAVVGIVVGSINDVGAIVRGELQPRDFAENRIVDAGEAGAGRAVQGIVMMGFAAAPFEAPILVIAGSVFVVGAGVTRAARPVRRRVVQRQQRRRRDGSSNEDTTEP